MGRRRSFLSDDVRPEEVDAHLRWRRQREQSIRTVQAYGETLDRLRRFLKTKFGVGLLEATPEQLAEWRNSLDGLSPGTIGPYLAAVRGFYVWATRRHLIPEDPSWELPIPRRRRRPPRPVGEATTVVAIENAPPRIRPWLVLAAYAGARCVEIANLRREDIRDTDPQPVIILRGKGGKERIVPLAPYVWSELLAAGLPRRGPVFTRRDGQRGPNTPNVISTLGNAFLHDIGISETMHQFRHRFGTRARATGTKIEIIADVMGHESLDTTRGYTGYTDAEAIRMVLAVQPQPDLERSLEATAPYMELHLDSGAEPS
jgi:integrase